MSVPVARSELATLRGGDHWTVASVHQRLDFGNEPWNDYAKAARSLTPATATLGYTLEWGEPSAAQRSAWHAKAAA